MNADVKKVKAEDYDLLVVPGGLESPDRLRQIPEVLQFIRDMDAAESDCIGMPRPLGIVVGRIVKGKKMTCYVGCKDDLINAGPIIRTSTSYLTET